MRLIQGIYRSNVRLIIKGFLGRHLTFAFAFDLLYTWDPDLDLISLYTFETYYRTKSIEGGVMGGGVVMGIPVVGDHVAYCISSNLIVCLI